MAPIDAGVLKKLNRKVFTMSKPKKSPRYFSNILIGGVILTVGGGALYFYTLSIPSSGVAMDGIAIGLLALLGLVLAGVGALVAFVSLILWFRAKSRAGKS